jgi:hypothetical protein
MKIRIPYKYTEDVIPKRCRKPRPQSFDGAICLTIHEVTGEEAPVAIVQHSTEWTGEDAASFETHRVATPHRWWRRRLYVRAKFQRYSHAPWETQTAAEFAADPYPFSLQHKEGYDWHCYSSQAQRRKAFQNWAKSILFIDGERWEVAGEPRCVVMTFGLGCNHGIGCGTDLCTDTGYNSNISRDRYFRIDQFTEAVAETARIALARGDTKAVPVIETQNPDTFEILIPEAVRLNPHREHGKGCAFMNQMEGIIERAKDPTVAGLLAIMAAFREPREAR